MKFVFDRQIKSLWLAIVGTATIVLLAAYAMVQQSTRLGANEQPLAIISTTERNLDNGLKPEQAIPTSMADSQLFAFITDSAKNVLASSSAPGEAVLLPPTGSFDYARSHGIDKFTWQPSSKARYATLIVPHKDNFIVAGQSLRYAEERIDTYFAIAWLAWLALVSWTTLALAWRR